MRDDYKRHIRPAAQGAGFRAAGWYSFRHSYCEMLSATDANTSTQQSLERDASVSTIMNMYGRTGMKAKSEANSQVVQMIPPRKEFCVYYGDLWEYVFRNSP